MSFGQPPHAPLLPCRRDQCCLLLVSQHLEVLIWFPESQWSLAVYTSVYGPAVVSPCLDVGNRPVLAATELVMVGDMDSQIVTQETVSASSGRVRAPCRTAAGASLSGAGHHVPHGLFPQQAAVCRRHLLTAQSLGLFRKAFISF
jgi:hypothetical protein